MIVGPGKGTASDIEVAKLECAGLGAVLLRHRLVNQFLVRLRVIDLIPLGYWSLSESLV
jgi:hypothetical protein